MRPASRDQAWQHAVQRRLTSTPTSSCRAETSIRAAQSSMAALQGLDTDKMGRTKLHLALEDKETDSTIKRLIAQCPGAAKVADRHGRLPLHIAAANQQSTDVFKAVLKSFPEGAQHMDGVDRLPLHYAAASQAAVEVVEALLVAYPAGACEQNTSHRSLPLHYAAANQASLRVVCALLKKYPDGAESKDAAGNRPLHYAVASRSPDVQNAQSVVEALLAAKNMVAKETDKGGNLPLHLALANHASLGVIKALLKAHPDSAQETDGNGDGSNDGSEDGSLPLHLALANHASLGVIKELLEAHPGDARGAEETDKDGNLPLHLALANKAELDVVKMLLKEYPDGAEETDEDANLPLHCALIHQAGSAVVKEVLNRYLHAVKKKNNAGDLPLHCAVASNALMDELKALLSEFPEAVQKTNKAGDLPLHCAVANKAKLEVVQKLLATHADLSSSGKGGVAVKNKAGDLPLHCAVANKAELGVVQKLLEKYKDGGAANKADGSKVENKAADLPLHCALANQATRPVVMELLGRHSEAVGKKNKDGDLPLHCAVANEADIEVVLQLLAKHKKLFPTAKGGVTVPNNAGDLPLHCAVANKATLKVMQELLRAYPEAVQKKNNANDLPLHCAVANKASLEVVNVLLTKYPAAVKMPDKEDSLPLHLAARYEAELDVVGVLIEKHADGAQSQDKDGWLPLHLAILEPEKLHPKVVSALLKAHGAGARVKVYGMLPLQHAVDLKAPATVVAELLAAHPYDVGLALQQASQSDPEWNVDFVEVVAIAASSSECRSGDVLAWHETVKVEKFAPDVARRVAVNRSLATLPDGNGVTAVDAAVGTCRQAMSRAIAFLGRYRIGKTVHTSAWCTVVLATDLQLPDGDPASVVALKLMRDEKAFLSEVQPRVRHGLDAKYVVDVLRVHIAPSASDSSGAAAHKLLKECAIREGDVHGSFGAVGASAGGSDGEPYRLCIVMPRGDCSLLDALQHERFAGNDWGRIKRIGVDVLTALRHMHSKGLAHCDVKPLNVMRFGEIWKVIDLDVAQEIGRSFGGKPPSSGYCAPELAAVLLAAAMPTGAGRGRGAQPPAGRATPSMSYVLRSALASVAYDLWSFGVLLFFMCTAGQLLQTDLDDNLEMDKLKVLASWKRSELISRLGKHGLTSSHVVLVDLLSKLLEPQPAKRLAYWVPLWEGASMPPVGSSWDEAADAVLKHPFFTGITDSIDMAELRQHMRTIHAAVKNVEDKLDRVLVGMQVQTRLLSGVLTEDKKVPSLLIFVPVEAGRGSWLNPSQWLNKEMRVHFVDPISMEWDERSGFKVKFTKEWVKKALPYIKVGITLLKVASAAGRLAGFPVGDLAGEVSNFLNLGGIDAQVLDTQGDQLEQWTSSAMAAVDQAIDEADREQMSDAVRGAASVPLRRSCADVKALLDVDNAGWESRTSLHKTVCTVDGSWEWVLEKHIKDFEALGSELLGAYTKHQPGVAATTSPPMLGSPLGDGRQLPAAAASHSSTPTPATPTLPAVGSRLPASGSRLVPTPPAAGTASNHRRAPGPGAAGWRWGWTRLCAADEDDVAAPLLSRFPPIHSRNV